MSLKVVDKKFQFLGTTKKLTSLDPWRQNAKWWKISTESMLTGSK